MKSIVAFKILLALCVLCGGCAYPRALSSAAGVRSIRLTHDQTLTSGKRVVIVHAGVYEPVFQGDEGIFYKAPVSMEQTKPKPLLGTVAFLHGGIFIANADAKDKRDAIWLYTERVILGKLMQTRPLEMHRVNDTIVHE